MKARKIQCSVCGKPRVEVYTVIYNMFDHKLSMEMCRKCLLANGYYPSKCQRIHLPMKTSELQKQAVKP